MRCDKEKAKNFLGHPERLSKVEMVLRENQVNMITDEDLKELLEKIERILINTPNTFVTLKEIANDNTLKEIIESKWNLHTDTDYAVRCLLCLPVQFSLKGIDCREDVNYARWSYIHNPEMWQILREETNIEDIRQKIQNLRQELQKLYNDVITAVVTVFNSVEDDRKLKKADDLLDIYEATQKELQNRIRDNKRGDY